MRICFFNCTKVWGGGEKWHLDHAEALIKEGHEVIMVTNKNSDLLRRAATLNIRTKAVNVRNLSFLNPFLLLSVYLYFRKERIDVLLMNFSKDLKIAAPMAKLAGIPKIVYRRGSDIPIKNTLSNRFLFGTCLTDILANSEATRKSILQNNPKLFPEDRIRVIYNGISFKDTPLEESNNEIPVIGNLGRMVHQKRQDILLDVASILKQRGVQCRFRIGGEGHLMKSLKERALSKGLGDYVEFTGFVRKPRTFFQGIDIFALTSRWEGFGYVLAEAMLAKKPLVAFDVSSNPELVQNGLNGFLVAWKDKQTFADCLQKLVQDEALRKRMGEKGFEMASEKFNLEKNKKEVIDFLLSKNE